MRNVKSFRVTDTGVKQEIKLNVRSKKNGAEYAKCNDFDTRYYSPPPSFFLNMCVSKSIITQQLHQRHMIKKVQVW